MSKGLTQTEKAFGCLFGLFLVAIVIFGMTWIAQVAYNFVAEGFNWPLLDYWQVACILIVLSIIGSFLRK